MSWVSQKLCDSQLQNVELYVYGVGQVWDSETLECLRTLEGHEDNVRVLAVGERYVFSGSWDKSIRCAWAMFNSFASITCFPYAAIFEHALL